MRSKMQDNVELVDNRFYIIGRQDKSEEYTGGRKSMEELVRDWNRINFPLYSIINRRITKHRKMQMWIWFFSDIHMEASCFRL